MRKLRNQEEENRALRKELARERELWSAPASEARLDVVERAQFLHTQEIIELTPRDAAASAP